MLSTCCIFSLIQGHGAPVTFPAVVYDECSSSKLATCMSYSLVFCCSVFESTLWKKNGFLLSHVFWRALNSNYKYIFTVHN
jgi:hypothetical protein